MVGWIVAAVGLTVTLVGMAIAFRPRRVDVAKLRLTLKQQREHLEAVFLASASMTGKPRGLVWAGCFFGDGAELARDLKSGEVLALIPATISFEAVEGGDMEGLEAVGNLRDATAVFAWRRGRWITAGRALFNHTPEMALHHLGQLERVA